LAFVADNGRKPKPEVEIQDLPMPDLFPREVFRLRTVARSIEAALLELSEDEFWVRAHFEPSKRGRTGGGHCFGELVDYENGKPVAKLEAVIWNDDFQRIEAKLRRLGQADALAGSREICCLCSIRFHVLYGLRLQIFDVDAQTGDSQIEQNRRKILEAIQREGLLDKNKGRPLPAAPLRIGLITARGTAALADFVHTLEVSGYAFRVLLAPAPMQGPSTCREVSAALRHLVARKVDLVCIIRGGGSPIDLACFDDLKLARDVANCPVPVWVGIGHEIDVTALDFVAHLRHKTPTAAAEALVARVRTLDERLTYARQRLDESARRRIELSLRELKTKEERIRQGVVRLLERTAERLSEKEHRLAALLPERMLARGYSVTTDESGRIIRAAEEVSDGQTIFTRLAAGSLESVVRGRKL
jgi:exodeoxyribonuclease VII large subunit